VDALARFLPSRELLDVAARYPGLVTLDPAVALAHDALDVIRALAEVAGV
jgi:hypothetical protein